MAAATVNCQSEVSKWVRETFKEENFKSTNIEVTGSSEKGDGYLGNIAFVEVTARTQSDATKKFSLVLKYSNSNASFRERMPIRIINETEIFIYSTAVPTFERFEEKRNVKVLHTFMPKCLKTLLYDSQEVLVFQNLKTLGYDLYDRFEPFDLNHLKLAFESYGKLHGLSIAYRDQAPEEFDRLFGHLKSTLGNFLNVIQENLKKTEEALHTILEKNNEFELSRKLKERFPEGLCDAVLELLNEDETNNRVLLHGDCWNNNLMFQYDDPDKVLPKGLKFLDFQLSTLASPVYDLSYILYTTASDKELQHFDELLRVYHSSLSNTVKSLGSDPEELFPYNELLRQWKKYSPFGVVMAAFLVPIALSAPEDSLDVQEMKGNTIEVVIEKVTQKNYGRFYQRSVAYVKHFLEF